MRRVSVRLCLVCLVLPTAFAPVRAQPSVVVSPQSPVSRLAGFVSDTSGKPVIAAEVRTMSADGSRRDARTDDAGRFVIADVPWGPAQLNVRRLGFEPFTSHMTMRGTGADSIHVVLTASVLELSGIEVREDDAFAPTEFYERKRTNPLGVYIDQDAFARALPNQPSDALRSIPGIVVLPSRRVGNVVRIRGCRPTVWIDGMRVAGAELDEVASVGGTGAIEIYKSLVGIPPQYVDRSNLCGAILVWTRVR